MLLGANLVRSAMAEAVKKLRVKVCIIGCGVSGAAAAGELVAAGLSDVVVLEAAGRPGGRVHTIPFGDTHIEMGANWLHGQTGNCVYEWAKQHCPERLSSEPDPCTEDKGSTVFVDPYGQVLSEATAADIQASIAAIEEAPLGDFTGSLGDFFQQQFSTRNEWGALGWQLLDWYGRLQCNIDGSASWCQVSAASRDQYWELPGPSGGNWCHQGYGGVMDHLLDRMGRQRVRLNSPALSVRWGEEAEAPSVDQLTQSIGNLLPPSRGSADENATPGEEVSNPLRGGVTLPGGSVIPTSEGAATPVVGARGRCVVTTPEAIVVADHVICSVSLGVLKVSPHLFCPPLPSRKLLAIQHLGYDAVAKVYLQFEQPWWGDCSAGFSFLNDLSCPPPDPLQEWEEHFLGFYPVQQAPCVLMGWLTGPAAQSMELTDLSDVIARSWAVLQRRLGHSWAVSKPVWGTRSTWSTNPSIRGAYSFRTPQADLHGVGAEDLAAPVCVGGMPVLQFCGEATHRHLYSTVPGAWEAGVREARRLLGYLKEGVMPPHSSIASLTDSADTFPSQLLGEDTTPVGEDTIPPTEVGTPLAGLEYLEATEQFRLPGKSSPDGVVPTPSLAAVP